MVVNENSLIMRRMVCLFGLLLVLMSGLSEARAEDRTTWPVTLITPEGAEHIYHLELAATAKARSRGLMFRTKLPEAGGMLFVWPEEKMRSFWMKNTPLSLDILYFSEPKKLISSYEYTTPFSMRGLPSVKPARYVVELNAGQAQAKNLRQGTVLKLPEALVATLAQLEQQGG